MVRDVVPVVERILVVTVVDRLIGQSAVEFKRFQVLFHGGNVWMHEDMLREVAKHEGEATNECWQAHGVKSEDKLVLEANSDQTKPSSGPSDGCHCHLVPLLFDRIDWEQKEARPVLSEIVEEVQKAVPLVGLGRAHVVIEHVVLDMMHDNVVEPVKARWHANEGAHCHIEQMLAKSMVWLTP